MNVVILANLKDKSHVKKQLRSLVNKMRIDIEEEVLSLTGVF